MNARAARVRELLLFSVSAFVLAGFVGTVLALKLDTSPPPSITIRTFSTPEIAVDVRGSVATPGVVYLPPGSRMIDVVTAAGGLDENANPHLVNMSTRVYDGQMIVIPTAVPESAAPSTLVNINTASVAELRELPGIGEVYATRIVEYRVVHGPYQSVDDLLDVEGISPGLLDSLREFITVDSGE